MSKVRKYHNNQMGKAALETWKDSLTCQNKYKKPCIQVLGNNEFSAILGSLFTPL